jgi:hypothetical protein
MNLLPTFCRCEAVASIRHAQLGSCLEPQDIKSKILEAIWRFGKVGRAPVRLRGTEGRFYL